MEALELQFLLKLLAYPNYRASISKLQPSDKTKSLERDRICRELASREIVAYSYEVKRFKIDAPGKALLRLKTALPVTEAERTVLQACRNNTITPGQSEIPAADRGAVIQGLLERGLVKVVEDQIKEVWLTERGQTYLREEYTPSGTTTITLNLLRGYLQFLRKSLHTNSEPNSGKNSTIASGSNSIGDEEMVTIIRKLDDELGTENYLPIFHLREKMPSLSRSELDQIIYRLQRSDRVELSSLQESALYTPEQIEAGIPQDIGGPLFFITVN